MIPQVMIFTFLFLTSLVAISKDIEHQNLTLATAWNVTNTVVIGVFIAAAFRESHRAKKSRAASARRRAASRPASFETPSPPATRQGASGGGVPPRRRSTRPHLRTRPLTRSAHLMTWINRLRLLAGLLVVLRRSSPPRRSSSTSAKAKWRQPSASIKSLSYSIGSDYPGIVVEQSVKQGDEVVQGQPLMTIQSPTLTQALSSTTITVPASSAYTVTDDGMLSLLATENGVISKIDASVGGFVGVRAGPRRRSTAAKECS